MATQHWSYRTYLRLLLNVCQLSANAWTARIPRLMRLLRNIGHRLRRHHRQVVQDRPSGADQRIGVRRNVGRGRDDRAELELDDYNSRERPIWVLPVAL